MDNPRDLFHSEHFAKVVRIGEDMGDNEADRRVQRSRQGIMRAFGSLMREKRFDKITVQEIIERANVGRTTFYAHFQSKEDLFLSGHEPIIAAVSGTFFDEAGNWRTEPSPDFVAFLEMGCQNRDVFVFLTWGGEQSEILRLLKQRIAASLAARLEELFRQADSAIPFDVLAQHVAGSMVAVTLWWMDKRIPYSAQEMAMLLHQMNQAALRSALGEKSPGG